MTVHHVPKTISDYIALAVVKAMRVPADLFFSRRYGHRAVVLETVAAVPGMVGGALQHLKSLRTMQNDRGKIKTLIDEAENERMHLMTFVQIAKPTWLERMIILIVQGLMFNVYFLLYLISPKTCHRIVGYLEEEAIISYTEYLAKIDSGSVKNVPAPQLAIDYWRLPAGASLHDLVIAIRDDEAHHRDVNHAFADSMARTRNRK
ncbi:MAG: alternative oxidase [Sulfuricaulis sp.]